jgi:hypothetical protein
MQKMQPNPLLDGNASCFIFGCTEPVLSEFVTFSEIISIAPFSTVCKSARLIRSMRKIHRAVPLPPDLIIF